LTNFIESKVSWPQTVIEYQQTIDNDCPLDNYYFHNLMKSN